MNVSNPVAMLRNRLRRAEIYCRPEYWNAKAETYAGHAISMWPNNNLNQHYVLEQERVLHKLLPDVADHDVLDVGCGTGRISRLLATWGARIVGFDFSEKSVAVARELSPGENPSYRVQSVFELDDVEQFDIALCWGVLTVACRTRDDLAQALRRIRASLRPNGTAAFLEPIHRGFLSRVLNLNLREFCEVLTESGFTVRHVEQMHFWPTRLMLAYVPWPRLITSPIYHLGQFLMRLPGLRQLGDYKCVVASPVPESIS